MNQAELKLREINQGGIQGIINILRYKGTLKKSPLIGSLAVSTAIVLFSCVVNPENLYTLLIETIDLLLSFFPNLLGFSLGGYSLIVGFGNLDLIKRGSKVDKYSVYQILNAIFSLSIILQVITTIISFAISWALKTQLLSIFTLPIDWPTYLVNAIVLWVLSVSALYSLVLTPYVVSNLFTLSQVNHLYLTVEHLKELKAKEEEKRNATENNK